jgi:ATP-dependent Clp protease protease subunit
MDGADKKAHELYAAFSGAIDHRATGRLLQGLAAATTTGVSHVHLLFVSSGGLVSEGIALYNFFRAYPIPLTLYNVGSVSSIAVIAYLGAAERKASTHAMFMVHRAHASPQAANSDRLKTVTDSLILDDKRTEAILRQHIDLSDEMWATHRYGDLYLTGEQAVSFGLATALGEFSPPPAARLQYF